MKSYKNLKYSGFEWLGSIPDHWKLTKNRYGFKKIFNGFNQSDDTPVLSLTIKGIKIKEDLSFGKSSESYIGHQLVKKGNIVFTPRDFDQTPILSDVSKFDGCISNLYVVDETKEGILNFYVNFYWWGLKYSVDYFKNFSHGMRYSFNRFQFDEIPLLIPPLNEQIQIVKFLDEKTEVIDKLISTKERKIDLLKQQRTSLISEVVTKGLNPNVKMKDSGVEWIGKIPDHWNMISIKHLVSTKVTDGPHETPVFLDEGIPFLSVESVQDNKLDFERKRGYISKELHQEYSKKCKPQRDDIFIVKSGSTTGKSTIVETDEEFNIWSPLCIIRSNKNKIIPRFTFSSIQSSYFRRFVELGWSFGTQPNIGMGVIENIRLVVPPITEQQQIVDYLDTRTKEIDDLVSMEQKKIDLLKEYRQSLISEVVTGKIDVRTNLN